MHDNLPVDPFEEHDHSLCASVTLDRAVALAEETGARMTPVRRRTLEILLESHRAMGAYDVLERLAAEGFGKQPPVAYRALDFLVEQGLVHRIQRLNAYAACLSPGEEHSPIFLICRSCDRVAEAHAPMLRASLCEIGAESGFHVERTTVEVLGICALCAEQERANG